ncbi:carboxylesterase family protein [Streptomyces sp. URMC 126]|uniref:carboxylesterase family protein n=1 Tax=Streptomyces sp. URMC 126 TaxID=3423401 RepID=UPI003F1C5272
MWHDTSADDRAVPAPSAREVAARGVVVAVPDWRADAADTGRAALLGSLAWCRANAVAYGGDPDQIVLAGWSAGASAALAVTLRPDVVDGRRPAWDRVALRPVGADDRDTAADGSGRTGRRTAGDPGARPADATRPRTH